MSNVIRGSFGRKNDSEKQTEWGKKTPDSNPAALVSGKSVETSSLKQGVVEKAADALRRVTGDTVVITSQLLVHQGLNVSLWALMDGPYPDIEKRILAYTVSQEALDEAREAHGISKMTKLELEAILDDENLNPGKYGQKPKYLKAIFHEHASIMRGDRKPE